MPFINYPPIPCQNPQPPEPLDKTFIVTGGANGLGAHIVYFFLLSGARVAIFDLSKPSLELLETRLTKTPPQGYPKIDEKRVLFIECDVADEASVGSAVRRVTEIWGDELDGLVNNAGIPQAFGTGPSPHSHTTEWTSSEFQRYMQVNLVGTFHVSKGCSPLLAKRAVGSERLPGGIVHVGSVRSYISDLGGQEGYAASKGGINSLIHSMAASMGKEGVRVNGVSPGFIDVRDAQQTTIPTFPLMSPETQVTTPCLISAPAKDIQFLPQRYGHGGDVAKLVWFLVNSDESGFITAQDFCCDGGMTKKKPSDF